MDRTWWDAAAALLLGTSCVGCARAGRSWCSECDEQLQAAVRPETLPQQTPLVVCCDYSGCVPGAVVGYKDRGVLSLRPRLGDVLAAGVADVLQWAPRPPVIVPAPSSPAAVRSRGFDHMWDLARRAGRTLDVPAARLLTSQRRRDLAGRGFVARRRAVQGTMRARPGDLSIVVVDDVRTSGATLGECRRALEQAGHDVIAEVVVASMLLV